MVIGVRTVVDGMPEAFLFSFFLLFYGDCW